jgi:hypothetical protein
MGNRSKERKKDKGRTKGYKERKREENVYTANETR